MKIVANMKRTVKMIAKLEGFFFKDTNKTR